MTIVQALQGMLAASVFGDVSVISAGSCVIMALHFTDME